MEQYFEVTSESFHHKEYIDYVRDLKNEREVVKRFADEYGITDYAFRQDKLYVISRTEDAKKFKSQLAFSQAVSDCIPFRKNSKIGKAFAGLQVKHAQKPFVPFFFDDGGYQSVRTRLFDSCGKVYCSIAVDCNDKLDCPKGFTEMKASEFFKIIESIEEE